MSFVLLSFLFLIIIFFVLSLTHIFFSLIIGPERKKGSLQWLNGSLYLDWSAKKIGFDLFNHRIWKSSLEKKEVKKKKRVKPKKRRKLNYKILWQEKEIMLKTAKIILISFFDFLKKSKLKKFSLGAKIATPDPALTGVLYGGISSLSLPLSSLLSTGSIYIYPDFETESPEAKMEISLKSRLFDILCVLIRAFFHLPKIALIKTIRKLFKKRR